MTRINEPHMTTTLRQQTEEAAKLPTRAQRAGGDAATRLHRTFGGQVAANLRGIGYGG
jgi:hypothetical protein